MKIAIVGAGAVGGVVAWHLARAGADVTIVARQVTAADINRDGLTVTSPEGRSQVAVKATADPTRVGSCDAVFVGVKAQDWPAILPLVQPLTKPETMIVPMLNGIPWWYTQSIGGPFEGRRIEAVDPDGLLGRSVPAAQIIGCVVYMGAARDGVSDIRWNGRKRLVIGEPRGPITPRLERLASVLNAAGMTAEPTGDIRAAIWEKLLGNTTFNPMSVITGATIGRFGSDPGLRRIVRLVMEEMVTVAHAMGVSRDFSIEQRLEIAPSMRNSKTSTLQDFEAGRPLELGALVDAVLELGRWTGHDMPMTQTIGALARASWQTRWGQPA
jgi:2-dehydropantoate 2-reductase